MDNETKEKINERYDRELNRGEQFWPDSIYKDLIVSLGIFIILILLATFIGVSPEPKADPADTSYLPRPEWYFLFLFQVPGALWANSPDRKDRMVSDRPYPGHWHWIVDSPSIPG